MAQQAEAKCPEIFGKHNSKSYKVTDGTVKSLDGAHGYVYGTKAINRGYHEWVIKYENTGHRCCGAIGIATHFDQDKQIDLSRTKPTCIFFWHQQSNNNEKRTNLGQYKVDKITTKLNSGDAIRIALDYDGKTVAFYDQYNKEIFSVNNFPTGYDVKYRLFVDGDGTDDKYTILKSDPVFNISLENTSKALLSIKQSIKNSNKKLKRFTMKELVRMKQQTSAVLDEWKEFEQNVENIKKDIQSLDEKINSEMNPDTKTYKSWKVEQICRYVLSLENQRFAKYMDALSAALQKQQICGGDLPEIEANDLYTMGIDNFKDRKCLAKYFKKLDTNEGDIATEHH